MNCPTDGTELRITDRQGIEIDYCPTCRGVWLDRGELDKIIERSLTQTAPAPPPQPGYQQSQQPYQQPGHQGHYGKPHKRKESWLSELFD